MIDHSQSDEAKAKRAARRAMARSQADDPLVKRAKHIAFWKECAKTNKAYTPHNGAWWSNFRRPHFRKLLLPRVRARLNAKDAAWDQQYRAELRESARRWEVKKAERTAYKRRANAPQHDMFTEAAAC